MTIAVTVTAIIAFFSIVGISIFLLLAFRPSLDRLSQAGEAVSGFIGTFISLLGFIIVSATLIFQYRESLHTNEVTRIAREVQLIESRYGAIKDDIDKLTVNVIFRNKRQNAVGRDAIEFIAHELIDGTHTEDEVLRSGSFQDLFMLCGNMDSLRQFIISANLPEYEKNYFLDKLTFLYTAKLSKSLIYIDKYLDATEGMHSEENMMLLDKLLSFNKTMIGYTVIHGGPP